MSAPKKRCPGCAELATECVCDFAEGSAGPLIPEGSTAILRAPLALEPPGSPAALPAFQAPEQWTPEQVEKFEAEWARLTGDPKGLRHQVRLLPPGDLIVRCRLCLDDGMVCEAHPEFPWEGIQGSVEGHAEHGGIGMPCRACCSPIPEDGTHSIAEAFTPDWKRDGGT